MANQRLPGGVVHKLPADLRRALIANPTALDAWRDITPLARNEFICWVEDAKQQKTRERRIRRTKEELEEGQRRPCCWPGCAHRGRVGRPVGGEGKGAPRERDETPARRGGPTGDGAHGAGAGGAGLGTEPQRARGQIWKPGR